MTPAPSTSPMKRRRSAIRTDDVRKVVQGAIAGGMPIGRIDVVDGRITLFAVDANLPATEADDIERRMQEAFED